jgi:hypothetical protein
MKKTILIILITISFNIFSQHPDLEQRWYVQNVTINNITTILPQDLVNFPFAYLHFLDSSPSNLTQSENASLIENCQIGFNSHVNHISTNTFEFVDLTPFSLDTECDTSLQDFMNLYISFYTNEITEQFTYSITTETDETKTLTITNNNNDIVVFTNKFYIAPPIEVTNVWYLHNLIINGVDNIPPSNSELTAITLRFNIDSNTSELFFTQVCAALVANQHFITDFNDFYLYDNINMGLNGCSIFENGDFQFLYFFSYFLDALPGPFHYQVTTNGSTQTLTITNINGDQAIYGNNVLSTQDYIDTLFTIYPNPTTDNIIINEKTDIKIENINIYNTLGKLIIKTKNNAINLSNFENGLYLFNIKLKNGKQVTKKIIKQ